ncbi:hypothetical protein [Endozoicomonas sp. GU-1]|uniref:hypothetical protein n=1 Tax=Endozoicomonas sp. GU-1 TaxID=3009078 RepID=UPI0022B5D657|nr:hypothetical protein [Endozoicomonas sp. GU-1]WBA80210.1 hypothetical protein O2T12_17965 [Endozoicomonas sp. GU-1]WBA87785.1 hypothetical protein O3276_07190 [Endozoicomonas sp. GU-1]
MTDPFFNTHFLCMEFQKAYESVMSNNGLVWYGWPQQRGLAFGLQVEQAAPVRYLDTSIPCGASFNNPVRDVHFKKVPASAIYFQESEQGEPIDLSHRLGTYRQAENTKILTVQPEARIDRVGSMGGEANAYLYSINANHTAPASTLQDTAVNESDVKASTSGSGESPTISHDKGYQKANAQSEKREATRKAYREPDKGRVCQKTQTRSEKRRASQKAYAHSEKGKATRKAYDQSEKRRAAQKINNKTYNKSEKGKAVRWAYENSEKRKACKRAYQKVYHKAYYQVFKNTGDRERARIAAKQAIALKRESDKTKNNELSN